MRPELGVDTSFDRRPLAGDPRPHLRPDRPDLGGRPDLAGRRCPNITLYEGHARFVDDHTLRHAAPASEITADQIVIAAGSRPVVPPIAGLDEVDVPHQRHGDAARRAAPPDDDHRRRLRRRGVRARVLRARHRGHPGQPRPARCSAHQDEDISARLHRARRGEQWDVRLETPACTEGRAVRRRRAVAPSTDGEHARRRRAPDGHRPGVQRRPARPGAHRVAVDEDGQVVVDEHQRTDRRRASGRWATSATATSSSTWPTTRPGSSGTTCCTPTTWSRADHRLVPSAVFTHPQIASVGLTEQRPREQGVDHVTARQTTATPPTAGRWRTPASFAKLLADPATGRLLGAHIIGPQASNLIQPLVQAMSFGRTADEMARDQYWIHPALMEVVENVLLGLPLRRGTRRPRPAPPRPAEPRARRGAGSGGPDQHRGDLLQPRLRVAVLVPGAPSSTTPACHCSARPSSRSSEGGEAVLEPGAADLRPAERRLRHLGRAGERPADRGCGLRGPEGHRHPHRPGQRVADRGADRLQDPAAPAARSTSAT